MKKQLVFVLMMCNLSSFVPALAQTAPSAPNASTTETAPDTSSARAAAASQTPEECMAKVKTLEPMVPKLIESARASVHELMPDPAAYEKTLPPIDKVVADKDAANFKNYGGLCEAYFFAGDEKSGQRIYDVFIGKEKEILGADNTYGAYVQGDIGILKYLNKDYTAAEAALLPAIKQLETHLTPAVSDNLIASYLCMAIIRDNSTDPAQKKEGPTYAKKLVDLAVKQRQPY